MMPIMPTAVRYCMESTSQLCSVTVLLRLLAAAARDPVFTKIRDSSIECHAH